MMQCLERLLLLCFVCWTIKAQVAPKPTFDCSQRSGGCIHKMDLQKSTVDKWNLYSVNRLTGEADNSIFGGSDMVTLKPGGSFCVTTPDSIDLGVERVGFSIQFASNAADRTYNILYMDDTIFTGEVDHYGWEEVKVENSSDCDIVRICIQPQSEASIKNLYVQVCTSTDHGEDDPPAGSHIASNEICTQDPALSNLYTSVAKGLPLECPAQESGCPEFTPYINLFVTNAHYVTFICLDEIGNQTATDKQTITYEDSYVVVAGDIGDCIKVIIEISWYQGTAHRVDNVDLSVCARNDACFYHICEPYGITSTSSP